MLRLVTSGGMFAPGRLTNLPVTLHWTSCPIPLSVAYLMKDVLWLAIAWQSTAIAQLCNPIVGGAVLVSVALLHNVLARFDIRAKTAVQRKLCN